MWKTFRISAHENVVQKGVAMLMFWSAWTQIARIQRGIFCAAIHLRCYIASREEEETEKKINVEHQNYFVPETVCFGGGGGI